MRTRDEPRAQSVLEWALSPPGVIAWSRWLPGLQRRLDRPALTDLTQVRRLGILRSDGMGDLILTTGMFRELRRQLPDTQITFICQKRWAAWMRTCPWIDDVVDVDETRPGWLGAPKRAWELARFITRVWPLDFEVLLQPGTAFWYVHSRALAWFTGAPVRLCWEDSLSGVEVGGMFHTHRLAYPNAWHETEKCFRMLQAMGLEGNGRRLETWWTPDEAQRGETLARETKRGRRTLVALGLAGSEAERRWPEPRYLTVIRDLTARGDVAFLVFGGSDVASGCRWVAEQAGEGTSYAGENLTLGIVWAAIAQCDLYIGNDTGLMHMAAAARVPVVVVIGVPEGAPAGTRGDSTHTGPCETTARVVRPRDSVSPKPDIAAVSAEAVSAAAVDLLPGMVV